MSTPPCAASPTTGSTTCARASAGWRRERSSPSFLPHTCTKKKRPDVASRRSSLYVSRRVPRPVLDRAYAAVRRRVCRGPACPLLRPLAYLKDDARARRVHRDMEERANAVIFARRVSVEVAHERTLEDALVAIPLVVQAVHLVQMHQHVVDRDGHAERERLVRHAKGRRWPRARHDARKRKRRRQMNRSERLGEPDRQRHTSSDINFYHVGTVFLIRDGNGRRQYLPIFASSYVYEVIS